MLHLTPCPLPAAAGLGGKCFTVGEISFLISFIWNYSFRKKIEPELLKKSF